jgi:hypothetical protein
MRHQGTLAHPATGATRFGGIIQIFMSFDLPAAAHAKLGQ